MYWLTIAVVHFQRISNIVVLLIRFFAPLDVIFDPHMGHEHEIAHVDKSNQVIIQYILLNKDFGTLVKFYFGFSIFNCNTLGFIVLISLQCMFYLYFVNTI